MKHLTSISARIPTITSGARRPLLKSCLPLWASAAFLLSSGGTQAALIASFVETFSGGSLASANTAVYTLSSTSISSFTLRNGAVDGSFFDDSNDGYALLQRTSTSSGTNAILGAFGTVGFEDVGSIVSIDAGFRHDTGMQSVWVLRLDGVNVGGSNSQSYLDVSSFTGHDISNDSNILLSSVPANHSDTLRTPGALTYTIKAADVGKQLDLRVSVFDSSNSGTAAGNRNLLIDSISYTVIPEPTTALLGGLGLLGLLRRRR